MILASTSESDQPGRSITINGAPANMTTIRQFERQYNIYVESGSYWYDAVSGMWGVWGQPAAGYILPGMNLGPALPFHASGGATNVIVNGRAIHPSELAYLQSLGPVYAGRYWLDANGNYGFEGSGMMGNLRYAAGGGQGGRNSGGSTFFRNGYTGIGGGSSGGTSYVIGEDFSVIVD